MDELHADSVSEAQEKYMTKKNSSVESEHTAEKIPDEVWQTYLDGSAARSLKEKRVRERATATKEAADNQAP